MASSAKAAYEKAVSLFSEGKKNEAAQELLSLIAEHPEYADAYESLGMMYYKMGDLDRAIEWTQRLSEVAPQEPMAHTNLSIFYMKKGMKDRAEEEQAKATVLRFSKPKK